MMTTLPVDRIRDLPLHRNAQVAASPRYDEKVLVAELVPANNTFRVLFSNGVTLRLVTLVQGSTSGLWAVATEVSFAAPVSSPSIAAGMISTNVPMFHLVEEPVVKVLPSYTPAVPRYFIPFLVKLGHTIPTRARIACFS